MTVESEKELGNASYYKNKYAQAIVHYNNAINKCTHSADPKNSYLYNNRSQCFIHLRQYKRALEDCEEAIRLNPSNVKAYMRKGLCLRQLGQLEESRNAYNQATAYDTAKEWTQQITDGLMALPVFSNRPQQPQQQQQQGRPNVQQQQQQRPPQQQQQQQQQARPQSQPPQQQNHQQQYYIPQQGQYNAYPQFNPQHARYQYPGNYTVRSTGQYQPNVNYYAQPPTQYPTNTNVNNNNNAPRPQQPPPQQPPTTTTTSTTAPPPAPPPQQNNPTVAATSTTSSASSTSTTTTSASTNAASSSGRRSRSSSDVHEKKNCKNQ